MSRPISASNQIVQFMHCRKCVEEKQAEGVSWSPKEHARFEVGWTPQGIQVRCARHDLNIVHIDFEGQKHPANTLGVDPSEKLRLS